MCVRARHVQTLYRVCQLWFSVVDASARKGLR